MIRVLIGLSLVVLLEGTPGLWSPSSTESSYSPSTDEPTTSTPWRPSRPTLPGESFDANCTGEFEYYGCRHWSCPRTCEQWSFNGIPWECEENSNAFCDFACRCFPGYYYNSSGVCVPERECSSGCTDPNAVKVSCPTPCPETCETILDEEKTPCPKICLKAGCICKVGYVIGPEGHCILARDCPNLSCPPGKVLNKCVSFCSMPNTCDGYFNFIDCAGAPQGCLPKCLCPEGLYSNGTACVTPNQCCGENQKTVDCNANCDRDCSGRQICSGICIRERCVCEEGYVRENDKCIKPEECKNVSTPAPTCPGPNEQYYPCIDKCRPNCETLGTNSFEPGCGGTSTEVCVGGCDCKPEYFRDANNTCVPGDMCPCPGGNETRLDCGESCPNTCDNINLPEVRSCPLQCWTYGCGCKPGYVRNNMGECILIEDCPKDFCNDKNKIRTPCGNPCPITCDNLDNPPQGCPDICLVDGCVCKEGMVLSSPNGKCVDPLECPCKRKNQVRQFCGDYNCPTRRCPHMITPIKCNRTCIHNGCTCKRGYVQDVDGDCVLLEDCPPCGDKHAIYVPCGDPCPITCDNMDDPPKICKKQCILKGCACKEGYVRDARGKCIKPIKCPCKDPNEVRTECGDYCPITCDNKDDPEPRECPKICYPSGCTCRKGYVRNREGHCILPDECPTCGENAVMKPCADACPLTCRNIDHPPTICPEPCISYGCVCNPGYARDDNWRCIQATECPCSGENEVRLPCGDPCPVTCGNRKLPGPRVCPTICKVNGCACKDGYVRNEEGKCILPQDCPEHTCEDVNAVVKPCGDPCPITCENMNDPPQFCPAVCIENGCACKPGFVKNSEGICVEPLQCPCNGTNQIRLPCGDPCPMTCDNLLQSGHRACPMICLTNQCACLDGYVRDCHGECVLPKNCDHTNHRHTSPEYGQTPDKSYGNGDQPGFQYPEGYQTPYDDQPPSEYLIASNLHNNSVDNHHPHPGDDSYRPHKKPHHGPHGHKDHPGDDSYRPNKKPHHGPHGHNHHPGDDLYRPHKVPRGPHGHGHHPHPVDDVNNHKYYDKKKKHGKTKRSTRESFTYVGKFQQHTNIA